MLAADRAQRRARDQHRLVAQRAAARTARAARRPARGRPARAGAPARRGTSRPSRRSTASAAAVRSGGPAPSSANSTGVPSAVGVVPDLGGDVVGRRLGDHARPARWPGRRRARRSASRVDEPADRRRRGRGRPTPRQCVTPTPACVEQGQQLLAAGAGGGDDARPVRADDVGEAEAERRRRPRCRSPGPSPAAPRSAAASLSATSCSSGTLSLKTITSQPGVERVHRLDERAGAGHRDQHQRRGRARAPERRAGGAGRRRRGRCPVGAGRRRAAPRPRAASAAVERGVVVGARTRPPGRWALAAAGTSKPIPVEHARGSAAVAIATCAASTPSRPCDGAADLQQRHRVGVGARAAARRGSSCGSPAAGGHAAACRRGVPCEPAPGRGGRRAAARRPRCGRRRAARPRRRARRRCRRRGEVRRELGQHLAVQRAVEQRWPRAAWCAAPAARTDRSVDSGVATPGGPVGGQPAAHHVVARAASARPRGRRSAGISRTNRSGSGPVRPTWRDEPDHRGRGGDHVRWPSSPAATVPGVRAGATCDVGHPTHHQRLPVEVEDVHSRGTAPDRARSRRVQTSHRCPRSAHGTCAAAAADHPDARAADVDVDRVPAAVQRPADGAVRGGPQPRPRDAGAGRSRAGDGPEGSTPDASGGHGYRLPM